MPKGETLITQGQSFDYFYIIEKGSVDIYVNDNLITNYRGKGTFLGERAFLGETAGATVKTHQESEIIFVERSMIFNLLRLDTSFSLRFFRLIVSAVAYRKYQTGVREAISKAQKITIKKVQPSLSIS